MATVDEEYEFASQEFRVESTGASDIAWMAGVYFDTIDVVEVFHSNGMSHTGMGMSFRTDTAEEQDSWSVFGEVEFSLGDTVVAKVGGRYTDVKKSISYAQSVSTFDGTIDNPPLVLLNPDRLPAEFKDLDRTDDAFTPSLVVEWRPADDQMYYFSYRNGFKGGGYNHEPFPPGDERSEYEFDEETVDAYELGGKLGLLEGSATLNFALFWQDYEDLQVQSFDPTLDGGTGGFILGNAGKSRSRGAETRIQLGCIRLLDSAGQSRVPGFGVHRLSGRPML